MFYPLLILTPTKSNQSFFFVFCPSSTPHTHSLLFVNAPNKLYRSKSTARARAKAGTGERCKMTRYELAMMEISIYTVPDNISCRGCFVGWGELFCRFLLCPVYSAYIHDISLSFVYIKTVHCDAEYIRIDVENNNIIIYKSKADMHRVQLNIFSILYHDINYSALIWKCIRGWTQQNLIMLSGSWSCSSQKRSKRSAIIYFYGMISNSIQSKIGMHPLS